MEINGSNKVNITKNPAEDVMPAWSPDGKIVAFSSNRDGDYDVYAISLDHGEVKKLTDLPGDEIFPSWAPDGKLIAYEWVDQGKSKINIISLDRTEPTRQPMTFWNDASRPRWGSRQEEIMISVEASVSMFALSGGGGNALFRGIFPSWSPKGDLVSIAACKGSIIPRWDVTKRAIVAAAGCRLETKDLNGKTDKIFSRWSQTIGGADLESSWAPDSQWIVVSSSYPTTLTEVVRYVFGRRYDYDLDIVNIKTGERTSLNINSREYIGAAWSPYL